MVRSVNFVQPWNFLKNLIATIWDSFHGGASGKPIIYDLLFRATDGQNANPYYWSHSAMNSITLDPYLVYRFPTQSEEIFLVQPLFKSPYQGIEWFSQLAGLQWLRVLSMLIRGITITLTGDWHSGRLAALSPSIMSRNSLLTEDPVNVMIHQTYVSALKHNCNVKNAMISLYVIMTCLSK